MPRWHVGTFIGTLARKNEKLARFWHVGTLARGHIHHAGTYGTHGTRFSKLSRSLYQKLSRSTFTKMLKSFQKVERRLGGYSENATKIYLEEILHIR